MTLVVVIVCIGYVKSFYKNGLCVSGPPCLQKLKILGISAKLYHISGCMPFFIYFVLVGRWFVGVVIM